MLYGIIIYQNITWMITRTSNMDDYKNIEVMQEACPFPIIIDNLPEIICVGHFEWMITVTHNTFYNSQLGFLRF